MIPPYDHPDVIAGQGTAAKELFEEIGPLAALFVCLGGGGLLSGSALSARALAPGCKIFGVEPAAGNDGQQSLRAGRIIRIEVPQTIADGAQTQALGVLPFEIIRREVAGIFTATDAELAESLQFFATRMKIVVRRSRTGGRVRGWAHRCDRQRRQCRCAAARGISARVTL